MHVVASQYTQKTAMGMCISYLRLTEQVWDGRVARFVRIELELANNLLIIGQLLDILTIDPERRFVVSVENTTQCHIIIAVVQIATISIHAFSCPLASKTFDTIESKS